MQRFIPPSINLKKLSYMAILVNSLQIASALFIAGILVFSPASIGSISMRFLLIAVLFVTTFGAALDIREAIRTFALGRKTDMLSDSVDQLTFLNTEMRKQRHDFMNHLQVIYSLLELNEAEEALVYIERVHDDLNRIGKLLKTAHPAINALIAAKSNDAMESGIGFTVNVSSSLEHLPLPAYEICRALGNLIDNASDALIGQTDGMIRLTFEDTQTNYRITVSNNGPAIGQESLDRIFTAGFSTKGTGRGMGLSIVSDIVSSVGGSLYVDSSDAITRFTMDIPRKSS